VYRGNWPNLEINTYYHAGQAPSCRRRRAREWGGGPEKAEKARGGEQQRKRRQRGKVAARSMDQAAERTSAPLLQQQCGESGQQFCVCVPVSLRIPSAQLSHVLVAIHTLNWRLTPRLRCFAVSRCTESRRYCGTAAAPVYAQPVSEPDHRRVPQGDAGGVVVVECGAGGQNHRRHLLLRALFTCNSLPLPGLAIVIQQHRWCTSCSEADETKGTTDWGPVRPLPCFNNPLPLSLFHTAGGRRYLPDILVECVV